MIGAETRRANSQRTSATGRRRGPGRGLLLFVLLTLLALPARSYRVWVEFGPPQHVVSINPKMGVHTRLTDEVEPWKVQRSFQMVREMGASWVVEFFLWAAMEPAPGVYDWTHADLVVDHALNQGLTVIARLGYVPAWARPPKTSPLLLEESHYDDFAAFAAAFAQHFRGRVNYIVIWNEPNLSQEWGYRPVDPAGYTEMLRRVYPAVKAADPQVKILGGALAPTLAPAGSEWALNDLSYLQAMYDAGARPYFDLLAAHSYGWSFSPDDPASPDTVNFNRVELLHDVMSRNGDGDKHVIITEGGWNDHPRWTKAVRPLRRVNYTIAAYQKVLEWPWVDALCIWAFRYPRPAGTYQDYYTFVDPTFQPKPIYLAVQRYARGEPPETLSGSPAAGAGSQ